MNKPTTRSAVDDVLEISCTVTQDWNPRFGRGWCREAVTNFDGDILYVSDIPLQEELTQEFVDDRLEYHLQYR